MIVVPPYFHQIFIFLFIFVRVQCDFQYDRTEEKLDAMLNGVKRQRYSREIDNGLKIWLSYEFGTGAGNREEVIVSAITIEDEEALPTNTEIKNWQYSPGLQHGILAGSENSSLWVYLHSNKDGGVKNLVFLKTNGTILTFKVINLLNHITNREDIIAVLCIEFRSEIKLNSYKISSGEFELISSSLVTRRVKKLDFFQHHGRNKLLLVNEPTNHNNAEYSSIEIYGFNFVEGLLNFWLCQRIWTPTVSSFEICSIYESTFLTIQSQNTVSLYEFKENDTNEGLFKLSQNITSKGLKNWACFKNGYTEYLILSGSESTLFTFLENEFLYDYEMENLFTELGETLWTQCLPVQTYREECLLLIQLKNSTVIGLSWYGQGFRVSPLPQMNIENFQLSKITVIPKYGFIYENKIVKVEASLRDLPRPVHHQMEEMLRLQNSLEEMFTKQETILDESEKRIENSYHTNPVITGFWNLSEVHTETVTISERVSSNTLTVGSKLFTRFDVDSDLTEFDEELRNLNEKIEKLGLISRTAIRTDSPEVHIHDFSFNGGIKVLGTLHVKNFTFESMNGFTVEDLVHDLVRYDKPGVIAGGKSFPSIEAEEINILKINGLPLEEVVFDTENKNYENIDFSVLSNLEVNGSINFKSINGIDWDDWRKNLVWTNQPAVIPGLTIIHGDIIADTFSTTTLNGLEYPTEYVLRESTEHAKIIGEKTFGNMTVDNLKGIKRLNGIPYEDFVTLNKEQTLPHKVTFGNLIIDESLQIDGNITGIQVNHEEHRLTLNDTDVISADTTFTNLYVTGNIIVESSLNKKDSYDFDDIIRKSEKSAVINGHKTFSSNVKIETELKVTSKKYNGRPIDEVATFNGEQVFPNLRKISVPVTFEQIEYKQWIDLENYLNDFVQSTGSSECSEKKMIFNVPPVFEDVGFRTLNGNISGSKFSENFRRTFRNISFENLEVKKLHAGEVTPIKINGVKFSDFQNRRISITKPQILTGNYTIEYLKARKLKTQEINGMSLNDLEKFRNDFEDLFDRLWNGKMTIDTFIVEGQIQTNTINGERLANIYARNELRNVIVDDGFYVKDLKVHGFINGLNLTEYAIDSVFKTDSDVVFTGEKMIDILNCHTLDFQILNGHPIENIVNSNFPQTLTGTILVKGNISVKNSFASYGKINDVPYDRLIDRISYMGNNSFELHGDFEFVDDATIENLRVDGAVQGIEFDKFLDSVIFQNDDVDVSGTKIFTNSVTFRENFTISNEYNGLDLAPFNHHAVFIDKDIRIGSQLIFEEDLIIDGDLIVQEHLDCKTISNVDIEELKSSAIFLDRPSYVQGTLTFANATFESSMTVNYLNDIDLNAVIFLKEDQVIFNPLSIENMIVESLGMANIVNGHEMNQIFANTFMLHGNQTITGNVIFHGNVRMQNNFNPQFMNGINTLLMTSLDGDEKLHGTFEFASPLILLRDFHVFGDINDIDFATWETEAVYDSFPKKQLVTGNWYIRGNVTFEKDVLGKGLLNGYDVQKLSDQLEKRNLAIDSMVTNVKMNLESTCKDLTPLQKYAKNQIYRFKFFEYLQIMNFDVTIKSLHHFYNDDDQFLFINLEQCFLNTFVYNGSGFAIISTKQDFDMVEKWITLKYGDQVYFLTIGNGMCGKSFGNLWKFEEQTLTHIFDLGSIHDVKKIGDHNFLVISEERLEKWSIEDVHRGLYGNHTSYFSANEYMRFVPNTERVLLVENNYIHEFHPQYLNRTSSSNHFGYGHILSLKAGLFESEMFLYYDEGVSENNAFIFDGLSDRKIRQSIPTHKPTSFLIMNFDGLVETFLTFVKNGRSLEIFEYRGIEGFVYRESIKMQIDRTFGFKVRKHSGLAKTDFIGAVHGNTLTILEAKMYGEKLDAKYFICED